MTRTKNFEHKNWIFLWPEGDSDLTEFKEGMCNVHEHI